MVIQQIKLGTYPNDGTGDDLRTAFQKVNSNFSDLSNIINIANGFNLGEGVGIFAQRNIANLEFKSLTSNTGSVLFTETDSTVNLESVTTVNSDTIPSLGGNLDLNGFKIFDSTHDGNIETPIYGYSIPLIASALELLIFSNNLSMNFGSFLDPTGSNGNPAGGTELDMGYFITPLYPNLIDFGIF